MSDKDRPNQVRCPDCGGTWTRKTGKVPAKGSTWHRHCTPALTYRERVVALPAEVDQ